MQGIYIHIPFCSQFCTYCNFYSVKGRSIRTEFISALLNEASAKINNNQYKGDATLYLGGGTPSVLNGYQIHKIISTIKELSGANFIETTIEVNPDDITQSFAKDLIDADINRISMGIQSFNNEHLKWMNRRHSADGAINSYNILRDVGFKNISLDLIFGYTGLTSKEWTDNLRKIVKLNPEHISAYQMSIEPGSKLWKMHKSGEFTLPPDEQCLQEYSFMQSFLKENGYSQYEVSSFCKDGYQSKHNSSYWNRTPYLGLGPGAHSYDGDKKRSYNRSNVSAYNKHYTAINSNIFGETELLTDIDLFNEAIMLGLRTTDGIDLEKLDPRLVSRIEPSINEQIKKGNLLIDQTIIKLPDSKLFISDSIIRELFTY